jgi:hypothetical protein
MNSKPFLLVAAVLLLSGCGGTADSSNTDNQQVEVEPALQEQVENPFPKATEVRLFVEVDYDRETREPVFSNEQGIRLDAKQRDMFEGAIGLAPPPEWMAACFIPQHFFRYYNEAGEPIGEVSICFCCAGVSSTGSEFLAPRDGLFLSANYEQLEKLVEEMGEPTDVQCN